MTNIKEFVEYSVIGIVVIIFGLFPRLFIKRLKIKYLFILAVILIIIWEINVIRICVQNW